MLKKRRGWGRNNEGVPFLIKIEQIHTGVTQKHINLYIDVFSS